MTPSQSRCDLSVTPGFYFWDFEAGPRVAALAVSAVCTTIDFATLRGTLRSPWLFQPSEVIGGTIKMRDIRGDLQERAQLLERQITTVRGEFEQLIGQLKREHGGKIEDLKSEHDAVTTLMGIENRRLSGAPFAPKAQSQAQQPQQLQPQRSEAPQPATIPRIGLRRAI
jgi:hypothetical protein